MRSFLIALARALSVALRGVWRLVDGVWTFVRQSISPTSALDIPVQADAISGNTVVMQEPFEARLRTWARARATGDLPRLPDGVTPLAARWATSLLVDELQKVARASPDQIREHLAGKASIAGVRPSVIAAVEDDHEARLRAIRARGAKLSAAIRRSLDASEARRQRADEMADAPAY